MAQLKASYYPQIHRFIFDYELNFNKHFRSDIMLLWSQYHQNSEQHPKKVEMWAPAKSQTKKKNQGTISDLHYP